MNDKGISLFSVLFYTVAMGFTVIAVFSSAYAYGTFAKRYSAVNLKQTDASSEKPCKVSAVAKRMQLRNVKFVFHSPKAKQVYLVADFNMWGEHKLKLENNGSGLFTKTVILPQGEYKYFYRVDGQDTKDDAALHSAVLGDKQVSLRVVL